MAASHVLSAVALTIALILPCHDAVAERTHPDQPMYMLYARHPDKGNNKDAFLKKEGVDEIVHVIENDGKHFAANLASPSPAPAWAELKKVLADQPENGESIVFETSDLRRAQIEAIALKMTLPQKGKITGKLEQCDFHIVHSLEKRTGVNWQSESTLKKKQIFNLETGKPDRNHLGDYYGYLDRGWSNGKGYSDPNSRVGKAKKKFLDYVQSEKFLEKLSWPDVKETKWSTPQIYHETQLQNNWNDNINLIIAVGHGQWYMSLIQNYATDDATSGSEKKKHLGLLGYNRQLETTEFVLLKWEIDSGSLKITDFWDFPEKNRFGYDFAEARYVDNEYEYEDYGEYYDDEEIVKLNEIYQETKDNLVRAREQFAVAQRLMAGNQRRNRWNDYNY